MPMQLCVGTEQEAELSWLATFAIRLEQATVGHLVVLAVASRALYSTIKNRWHGEDIPLVREISFQLFLVWI